MEEQLEKLELEPSQEESSSEEDTDEVRALSLTPESLALMPPGEDEKESQEDEMNDFCEEMTSALDITEEFLSIGCENLDAFFNGGIPSCGLMEFVGPSGTGKTQIALQLCIMAQLPKELGGLNGGAIYIHTEGAFPSPRLEHLCASFKARFGQYLVDNPMDHIFVRTAIQVSSLVHCLAQEVPVILSEQPIRLIIVDSIAAPFRYDDDNRETLTRARNIRTIGRTLHDMAFDKNLVLVCTNQVTGSFFSSQGGPSSSYMSNDQLNFKPAMGLSWMNLVNHRIIVTKDDTGERKLNVAHSNYLPVRSIRFDVTDDGVFSEEDKFISFSVSQTQAQ